MKRIAFLLLLAAGALPACSGGNRHVEVGNPYLEKSRQFTQAGIAAMQHERWKYARTAFERALSAAQLTDDRNLIAHAWYNLGMARKSGGLDDAAGNAFMMALKTADQEGDTLTALRAKLALALMQPQPDWNPGAMQANLPPDIHLSAARLAQRQHKAQLAGNEYRQALKRSDASGQGLTYRGQAHLGLALLALEEKRTEVARTRMQQALALFRKVGAPKLIAYTLLKLSEIDTSAEARADDIRHALTIYRTMNDATGEKACVEALKRLEAQE